MRGLALSSDQSGEAGTPRLLAVCARSLSDVRLFHSGFSRPFACRPSTLFGSPAAGTQAFPVHARPAPRANQRIEHPILNWPNYWQSIRAQISSFLFCAHWLQAIESVSMTWHQATISDQVATFS